MQHMVNHICNSWRNSEKALGSGAYGNLVTINHGGGLQTRYAHISKILVKKGDIVKKEDLIAYVGNTGRSTGPHLHYEIRLNKHLLTQTIP